MLGKTLGTLLVATLVCCFASCRKLEPPAAATGVPTQSLRGTSSIPAAWGRLVSVTTESTYPDLMQLWFQDDNGNVRMVAFRLRTGELLNVSVFQRQ
jgi:hypothetical protein